MQNDIHFTDASIWGASRASVPHSDATRASKWCLSASIRNNVAYILDRDEGSKCDEESYRLHDGYTSILV